MFARSDVKPRIPVNKVLTLLLLRAKDSEYAHISLTVGPAEVSQEEIKGLKSEDLKVFASTFATDLSKAYAANGISIIVPLVSSKRVLPSGLAAIVTEHKYKMPDGRIRGNKKVHICTDRFTAICGITTSTKVSLSTLSDIDSLVKSIRLSDGTNKFTPP